MPTDKKFAMRLRSSLGSTPKQEFAEALEIWPNQLSRYLNGQLPEAPILVRMAKALGVTVDWLLTGHGESSKKGEGKERRSGTEPRDGFPLLLTQSWGTLAREHRAALERCHKLLLKGDRPTRSSLMHDLMVRDEWMEQHTEGKRKP